jgi:hypothetical protein
MLICNNGNNYGQPINVGTIDTNVKYNLSVNDGLRPYKAQNKRFFSPTFHITGPVKNTNIHHNIIIIPEKDEVKIENTLIAFGDWGNAFPNQTFFSKNVIRSQMSTEIIANETIEFSSLENDCQTTFEYKNRNPKTILNNLKSHKLFKDNPEFDLLHRFIKFRLKNPDPRFKLLKQ